MTEIVIWTELRGHFHHARASRFNHGQRFNANETSCLHFSSTYSTYKRELECSRFINAICSYLKQIFQTSAAKMATFVNPQQKRNTSKYFMWISLLLFFSWFMKQIPAKLYRQNNTILCEILIESTNIVAVMLVKVKVYFILLNPSKMDKMKVSQGTKK